MQDIPIGRRVIVANKHRNTLAHDDCYWTGTVTEYIQRHNDYLVVFDNGDEDWYRPDEISPFES